MCRRNASTSSRSYPRQRVRKRGWIVVGGTSLSGGEGRIFGTLIGALIIAVIQNGMNLTGVESYTQKVVLGGVILGAVLLDTLKRRNWRELFASLRPSPNVKDSPISEPKRE